jgi:uridine kinase
LAFRRGVPAGGLLWRASWGVPLAHNPVEIHEVRRQIRRPAAREARDMTRVLVGIAGGTGSGKTTLAEKIVAALPAGQALLVQQDAYYRDRGHLSPAERAHINFDEPDALEHDLLVRDLDALRAGRPTEAPQYDFATHTRRRETRRLEPRPIVVVEGILLFAVPEVRDRFDLRLYVDTPDDVRLLRRIKRDLLDRDRDIEAIESQYLATVRDMHERHVAPTRRHAHLIVPEGGENTQAVDVIVGKLLHMLAAT